jgi:hypothetical protein
MRGTSWLMVPVALAALAAGCTGDEARPLAASRGSATPDEAPSQDESPRAEKRFAALLERAEPIEGGLVGAGYDLRGVHYTSPTDAAAELTRCNRKRSCTTVIMTTADGWDHAAGVAIPDDLADLVSSIPLGRGVVAIKAKSQLGPFTSYPPFALYPDGRMTLLHIADEPRALDAASELLPDNDAFARDIGLPAWALGADVDAAELFGLAPIPRRAKGLTFDDVAGREATVVNVSGYHRNGGDEVWRFSESTDDARTWRTTDVPLPLADQVKRRGCFAPDLYGPCGIYRYTDDYQVAVGPGRSQALALTDVPEDFDVPLPDYLRHLWLTDDEKSFRHVPLPWNPMAFAGLAFASDGALLVAEAKDPLTFCADSCRAGRLWRLPSGGDHLTPMADAPALSAVGRDDLFLQDAGGGMIVARTGERTVVVSPDGYTWTEVTPGGR